MNAHVPVKYLSDYLPQVHVLPYSSHVQKSRSVFKIVQLASTRVDEQILRNRGRRHRGRKVWKGRSNRGRQAVVRLNHVRPNRDLLGGRAGCDR